MLLHITDIAAQLDWILSAYVPISDEHFATDRVDQAIEAAQQRRFPRATLSHQRRYGAGSNLDADAIERDDFAKTVGYVMRSKRARHS
jgi:hypothetical protein